MSNIMLALIFLIASLYNLATINVPYGAFFMALTVAECLKLVNDDVRNLEDRVDELEKKLEMEKMR